MRTPIIAGNWKMNKTLEDAIHFTKELVTQLPSDTNSEIIIAPPSTHLATLSPLLSSSSIQLSAQNMSQHESGAYTGEISASMIKSCGCSHVIIGHSECRTYHNESNILLNKKCHHALQHNLSPIFCIGETLEERNNNETFKVLQSQLDEGLVNIEASNALIIAYEPVWAIGTGKVATPEQAQEAHSWIRNHLSQLFSPDFANSVRLLYGGSVNPENAQDLLSQPDIDGALVGGACLKAPSFVEIIQYTVSTTTQ